MPDINLFASRLNWKVCSQGKGSLDRCVRCVGDSVAHALHDLHLSPSKTPSLVVTEDSTIRNSDHSDSSRLTTQGLIHKSILVGCRCFVVSSTLPGPSSSRSNLSLCFTVVGFNSLAGESLIQPAISTMHHAWKSPSWFIYLSKMCRLSLVSQHCKGLGICLGYSFSVSLGFPFPHSGFHSRGCSHNSPS